MTEKIRTVQIENGGTAKVYPYRSISGDEDGFRCRLIVAVQTNTHPSEAAAQRAMLKDARRQLEATAAWVDQMMAKMPPETPDQHD